MCVQVCVCVLRAKNNPSRTPFGVFVSINALLFILNLCHTGHFHLGLAWRQDEGNHPGLVNPSGFVFCFMFFPFGRKTRSSSKRALIHSLDKPLLSW